MTERPVPAVTSHALFIHLDRLCNTCHDAAPDLAAKLGE